MLVEDDSLWGEQQSSRAMDYLRNDSTLIIVDPHRVGHQANIEADNTTLQLDGDGEKSSDVDISYIIN